MNGSRLKMTQNVEKNTKYTRDIKISLEQPTLQVVLDRPKMYGNIGAIVRLAANLGAVVHICGPFSEEWKQKMPKSFKRSGLDYWKYVPLHVHHDLDSCLQLFEQKPTVVEVDGPKCIFDGEFEKGEILLFGPEDGSVPANIIAKQRLFIPSRKETRSLNLAQCVALTSYQAIRSIMIQE